jgi:hypothetical protein
MPRVHRLGAEPILPRRCWSKPMRNASSACGTEIALPGVLGITPGAPTERSSGNGVDRRTTARGPFRLRGTQDLSIFSKNALTFQSKTPSEYFVPYGIQDSLDSWSTDHERGNCAGLEFSSVPEDSEYPVVWHQLHQIL